MKRETCMRCGRHNSEVPLSEYGDVCVRCEESLIEQLGVRDVMREHIGALAVLSVALPVLAVQVLVEVVTHGG